MKTMERKLYLYFGKATYSMDLQLRKYNFIREIFGIEKESAMDVLEQTLKEIIEADYEISAEHRALLDERLKSYKENPEDLLDWDQVKQNW